MKNAGLLNLFIMAFYSGIVALLRVYGSFEAAVIFLLIVIASYCTFIAFKLK